MDKDVSKINLNHKVHIIYPIIVGLFLIPATLFSEEIKSVLIDSNSLNYKITNVVSVEDYTGISFVIENNGKQPLNNTRISVAKPKEFSTKEKDIKTIVDTRVDYELKNDKEWIHISIGTLRPKEQIELSLLSQEIDEFATTIYGQRRYIIITSNQAMGKITEFLGEKPNFRTYPTWAILLLIFFLALFAAQLFFEWKKYNNNKNA